MNKAKEIRINKKFQPLYTTDKRYILVTGGRGSGKTFAIQDFLIRLLEEPGQGILYTRFTMTSVEKTIIPLFSEHIELISDLSKYEITKTLIRHKEKNTFILFSGIKTSSGDQTANLKTLPNITTWVVEEGEDFNNPKSFTDIDDSIRSKSMQNRVIWIQNPTQKHHFIYKKFFFLTHKRDVIDEGITYVDNDGKTQPITFQRSTHENVEHIHTTYLDNIDNLDTKKVGQWNKSITENPKFWANKYGGAWIDMAEGAIFEHVNWIDEFPKHIRRISYGLDFGFNDPTVLVKCGTSDGELYLQRMLYESEMTTSDINKAFISIGIKKDDIIFADSADPKTIAELRKYGWAIYKANKGNDSIIFGINQIKKYHNLNIVNCEHWKHEQISYVWEKDKSTDNLKDKPVDKDNHLWDASRYGIQGLDRKSDISYS